MKQWQCVVVTIVIVKMKTKNMIIMTAYNDARSNPHRNYHEKQLMRILNNVIIITFLIRGNSINNFNNTDNSTNELSNSSNINDNNFNSSVMIE